MTILDSGYKFSLEIVGVRNRSIEQYTEQIL